ncbi:MAG: radical SAM protein [Deltaproteobacteria bacterium]|nr:radical SAM protein [Deltaproteobacteria bacterium]
MKPSKCQLKKQGLAPGSCLVKVDGKRQPACQATLKYKKGEPYRLITSVHLSRPENYLSIYQSGCNFSCRKCHSWYFSKVQDGSWYTPEDILKKSMEYEKLVIDPEAILLSPQGFGPARNIVAFTGGDLTCCPEFYIECTRLIKTQTKLWVLIETNGYGLTPQNLDHLQASGVDAFWLDIKAHDVKKHKWLTGCSNEHILRLPEEILKRKFTLEVLSLYIPNLVESDELEKIARDLAVIDPAIPFTILAFFPEHQMKDFRSPNTKEMIDAYRKVKSTGLKNIRLGNPGVFVRNDKDRDYLMASIEMNAV